MAAKILVLEDDANLNDLFTRTLQASGYECESVFNLAEARELLANGYIPDLMLFDVKLPDGNSTDILDEVATHAQFDQSRRIIVTSDSYEIREMVAEKNVHATLYKPVRPIELIEVVNSHLGDTAVLM